MSHQSLKSKRSLADSGSNSWIVMVPEMSTSSVRQAPGMLPSKATLMQAKLNSFHDKSAESLSLQRRALQAMSKWPYLCNNSSFSSSHASLSGAADSHSGGRHLSNHSKSERMMRSEPCMSKAVSKRACAPESFANGHPSCSMSSTKTFDCIFLCETQAPFSCCALRSEAASGHSQRSTQEPLVSRAHLRKCASKMASCMFSSSKLITPSPSMSRAFHKSNGLSSRFFCLQYFRSLTGSTPKVPFGSSPRRKSRAALPYVLR
mmetsp:Transcript_24657/g.56924  ORF Transcript_24657/g.56924 Transcript_24657/m.56924 type:complete len:262 (+) Transcript_24657:1324-2109(+)